MLIALHVLIAIAGLITSTWLLLAPSKTKLNASYGLLGGTIVTGVYLVVSKPGHLVQSCVTGLVYMAAVLGEVAVARRKLQRATSS